MKPEAERLWQPLCSPFLSPVLKHQTAGFTAFHLCLCQLPARPVTHPWRADKWRHSPQCQEATKPWSESSFFTSSPSWSPPESGLSMVSCRCVCCMYVCMCCNILPAAPFNSVAFLSKDIGRTWMGLPYILP